VLSHNVSVANTCGNNLDSDLSWPWLSTSGQRHSGYTLHTDIE
jgi:hypothetical protein